MQPNDQRKNKNKNKMNEINHNDELYINLKYFAVVRSGEKRIAPFVERRTHFMSYGCLVQNIRF